MAIELLSAEEALKAEDWPRARTLFEARIASDPGDIEALYGVGQCLLGEKQNDEAIAAFREALSRDPEAVPGEDALLAPTPTYLRQRQRSHRFVVHNIDQIRQRAKQLADDAERGPARIFVYWAQGIGAAPAVVRMCVKNLLDRHGPERVVVLDDVTVPFYVSIPDYVKAKTSPTAYSDVLRVFLLARYGGIWLDATCYTSGDVFRVTEGAEYAGVCSTGARISSWYIRAQAAGAIPTMHAAAMDLYWSQHAKATQYYMFHHIFESLALADSSFGGVWGAAQKFSQKAAHRLQKEMWSPYDEKVMRKILAASHVHKLTHKFDSGQVAPDSMIAHLLREIMSRQGPF